jgi:hypothetical protein
MLEKTALNVNDPDHDDDVLAELREIREELWARFDYDVAALFRYLREQERRHPPERLVSSARAESALPHGGAHPIS